MFTQDLTDLSPPLVAEGDRGEQVIDERGPGSVHTSEPPQQRHTDRLQLTPEGRAALGAAPAFSPLTADQVRDQWRQAMRAGARRMLDTLIEAYPAAMARADLAGAAGLEPTSGTFSTYLSNLRRNGLVHETAEA